MSEKYPSQSIPAIISRAADRKQQELIPSAQDYEDVTA